MANGAGIPRAMAIVPEVRGVGKFVADTKTVQTSVSKMVRGVNTSLAKLTTTSTALGRTSASVQRINSAISGSLSNLNRWASGFNATNNAVTRFGSNLDQIGQRISRMSFQLERLGRGLTVGLTLPIVAAGVAMVKAGKDFESALVKVVNLVGINEEIVRRWGETILDVSGQIGVLPTEMADALFAAASGLGPVLGSTAKTMEVLIEASKGQVVGMGEAVDIARVATAMMNAFGDANLTAKEAISLLVVGIREGNFEVDKLATSLGNVLGVASAIGAGADDVIAFVSAYTRFGVEPARAVTALNTALTNLIKPSDKNREILDAYGLSWEKIQEIIGGPGGVAELFSVMRTSMDELDFVSIFGQRGLKGVLAVTDIENFMNEYRRIANVTRQETENTFDTMAESVDKGSLAWKRFSKEAIESSNDFTAAIDEAIARSLDTLAVKIDRIRALIQGIFIGADATIAPFLKDYADSIIAALENIQKFIELNQETVRVIIQLAGALALLGPGLIILARLGQSVGFLLSVFGNFFRIVGYGVGIIAQFSVQLGVLAINVGARLVQGFILLSGAVLQAAFAFAAATAKLIAFSLASIGLKVSGLATGFISLVAALGPVAIALGVIGTAALAAIGGLTKLWDTISGVGKQVAESFSGHAGRARGWGRNLIDAFNQGILDGLIELVNILNQIGQILAYWLAPGSPPRIVPDIDQWGTKTMQEWIDGWALADFGAFNTIFDRVQSFLRSLAASAGEETDEGAIARVLLGTRQFLAEAINQIRELGSVTQETMDKIYNSIGTTTLELENYIAATLAAAATTEELAKAQERVNEINERYSALLTPIQEQLAEIDRQRKGISDDRELERLQRLIEKGNLPEQVEKLAKLRIREIGLQQEERSLETARDAELSVAEKQLQAAELANEAAQLEAKLAEEALNLQTKGFDLMAQINKAVNEIGKNVKALKEKADKIADSIAGGALSQLKPLDLTGGGDFFEGAEGLGGVIGEADRKLQILKDSISELGVTWATVVENAGAKIGTMLLVAQGKFNAFRYRFIGTFGAVLDTISEEGTRTWNNLAEIISSFWTNTAGDRENISNWFSDLTTTLSEELPGAITTFSDIVNDKLLPAIGVFVDFASTEFGGSALLASLGALAGPLALLPVFTNIGDQIIDNIFGPEFRTNLAPKIQGVIDSIVGFFEGLGQDIQTASSGWPTMGEILSNAFSIEEGDSIYTWLGVDDALDLFNIASEDIATATDTIAGWWKENMTGSFGDLESEFTFPDWEEIATQITEVWDGAASAVSSADDALLNFVDKIEPARQSVMDLTNPVDTLSAGVGGLAGGWSLNRTTLTLLGIKLTLMKTQLIDFKDRVIKALNDEVERLRAKIEEWRQKMEEARLKVIELALAIVNDLIQSVIDLYDNLLTLISEALQPLVDLLAEAWDWVKNKLTDAFNGMVEAVDNLKDAFFRMIEPLQAVANLLREIWNWIQSLPGWVIDWIRGGAPDFNPPPAPGGGEPPPGGEPEASAQGIPAPESFTQGNAIPMGIGASTARAIGQTIGSAVTFGTGRRRRTGMIPTVARGIGAVSDTGVPAPIVSFGDVIINNDMDMATFEARVRTAVSQSING